MPWETVVDWSHERGVHRTRPDPYSVWAALTHGAGHGGSGETPTASDAFLRSVIVELVSADALKGFLALAKELAGDIRVPRLYEELAAAGASTRYVTLLATRGGLAALANGNAAPGDSVKRFDLCDFVQPERPVRGALSSGLPADTLPLDPPRPPLASRTLVGIIDDGCAFAHASFRGNPDAGTRVVAMWDQDHAAPAFKDSGHGSAPWRFPYGWEIWKRYPQATELKGLDEWIDMHRRDGTVDEDACYDEAGYPSMRRRATHGSHVMDVLAGPVRLRNRVYGDRDTPPTWARASNPDSAAFADQSDLVFVQLPRAGLQDSSGVWLDSHVLDAVRFVASCAEPSTVEKMVINLSYGSTVGPHDQSSILAGALDEIAGKDPNTHIVMSAGNSFSTRGHAVFRLQAVAGDKSTAADVPRWRGSLTWRVLPGSEAPSFLQVWMPPNQDPANFRIRVAPPGVDIETLPWLQTDEVQVWPSAQQPSVALMYLKEPSRGGDPMALLALNPTDVADSARRQSAPHGDWTIEVDSAIASTAASPFSVHAYIARNDTDMAAVRRGRQSYFVDAGDAAVRYLRTPKDDASAGGTPAGEDANLFGPAARTQTAVRRRGTLNGIATGESTVVVAGYNRCFSEQATEGAASPYSSAGLGEDPRGRRPTLSLPSDESTVLRGMRAAGSRSGSTFRLIGTSTTAPQESRDRAGTATRAGPPTLVDPDLDGQGRRDLSGTPA